MTDSDAQVEAEIDRPDAADYIPERDLACEAEDAVGWMHIGVDPSCDPVGDYWVPVDDPELVERDHVPQDEVKQFPLEAREPEYGSGEPAPDHVHNWTFTEVDEAGGAQAFEFCNILVDWEDGMSAENLDERKCVNEAVGKFRYETHGGMVMEDWLCETHRDEFEDAIIEEVETA